MPASRSPPASAEHLESQDIVADRVYLDCNATAPVKPAVIDAMAAAMTSVGNPSSIHAAGRAARRLVSRAREQVAALVGAPPEAVIFTSGGTEANNQALAWAGDRVITSAIEHPSVLALADPTTAVPVTADGLVDLDHLRKSLASRRAATLAVMAANNETGVIQPVRDAAALAREAGVRLHVDAVQAAGKIPIDFFELGADTLSLSAHKMGGPQGVGALVLGPDVEPNCLLKGGAQERRLRAGTENLPGIVGFGEAARLAIEDADFAERVGRLRDRLEAGIRDLMPECRVFGEKAPRLANTSCLALPGLFSRETLLIALDLAGVAVSSGSACSSGKAGSSHVLAAMGAPDDEADGAIRASLGWNSTETDVDRMIEVCRELLSRHRLRRSARGI